MTKSTRHAPQFRGQATGTRLVGPLRVGAAVDSVEVDVSKLPPPSSEYDADFSWAEDMRGTVSLFFAKLNRDSEGRLASRIELRLGGEDAVRFVMSAKDFYEKLHERSSSWGKLSAEPSSYSPALPADRSHSQWASYLYVAYSGTRAVIDAYEMSVPGLARYIQTKDANALDLRPVVRIQMSVFEIKRMMLELEGLIPKVREFLLESKLITQRDLGIEENSAGTR
jgi:hypothetical protein